MPFNETIVVVDNDASMSQAIERLLGAAGWKARTFASAEALLESDAAATAGGFVFDIHLPGLSGFALHAKLRESGVAAPVVFITAHDCPEAAAHAQRAGAAGYLAKPFAGLLLLETLKRSCAAA